MSAKNGSIKLVAGNSNPALAQAIAQGLDVPLTKAVVRRFADMEIFVEIQENVRGSDAFIIQSTSFPANDNLMELLIITDALRRSSARRITAVLPYFGYARQDRKSGSRTPISAKLVANLITQAGVDRVMTLDLHAGQIQGFFDIPTDNLFAAPLMVRDIKENFDLSKVMVISPDVGGVARARGLAKRINTPLAIIDKRRERAGESEVMNVIGDCAGYTCILIDDIVDSGGTLVNAADALLANGAKDVYASPILLGDIWRQRYPDQIVVSPDVGGVVRARALAKRLGDADLAIIDKRRPKPNVAKVMHIIGDVEGRTCVLIDDLVDTAGTLCEAARALKEHGATKVVAYCTHPVLSGAAIKNIESSVLDELVVTDTIPLRPEARACPRIRQLTVAGMLAETMRRISTEESVSTLFMD